MVPNGNISNRKMLNALVQIRRALPRLYARARIVVNTSSATNSSIAAATCKAGAVARLAMGRREIFKVERALKDVNQRQYNQHAGVISIRSVFRHASVLEHFPIHFSPSARAHYRAQAASNSRPSDSATAAFTILPVTRLIPSANPASSAAARSKPRVAIFRA